MADLAKLVKSLALSSAIGLSAFLGAPSPVYGQAKPSISTEEVSRLMQKKTVEEILSGSPVKYVTYNSSKKKTNFDELVYQTNLPADQRKPVMVMWYTNNEKKNFGTSKRATIPFLKAAIENNGKMKFIGFDIDIDPKLASENYSGIREKYGVSLAPSFAIYTSEKGTIRQQDILKGGPLEDSGLNTFIEGMKYWVNINNNPKHPDFKKYKFNNSSEFQSSSK